MPTDDDVRIGRLAVDRGWVKQAQLDRAIADVDDRRRRGLEVTLGRVLYERKWIDADQLIWLVQSANEVRAPEVAPAAPERPAARNDLLFGKFEVVSEVARGAMGIVYKARHAGLGRTVALKVLREGEEATQEQVIRFHREAELAAKLRHPNIVPIHDVGVCDGKHYFTMDFIEGETLDARLRRGRPTVEEATAIVEKVARAVHFAHTKGIVHRDLKPANLLLDERGEPQVTDFGLARRMDVKSGLTRSGAAIGTPFYMAPEQICGDLRHIDARTDVFALGILLYEMLAGQRPFSGNSAVEIFQQITQEDPPPPSKVLPSVPHDLETVCAKALEKVQERRYATAQDLADDLARFQRGEPVLARPISWTDRYVRRIRRHRVAAGFAALAVASALTGAGLAWWHHVASKGETEEHARALGEERQRTETEQRGREKAERGKAEAAAQARDSEYRAAVLAAQVLAKEKKWDDAGKRLDDAIAIDADRADAWGERGRILRARKKPKEAIDELGKALAREPAGEWLYERACAWQDLKEPGKAEADLTSAIDLGPAPAAWHLDRGTLRAERGNDEGAITDFTWSIHRDKGKYEPWKRRGMCYLRQREWEKAEADFTDALDRYSLSAECLLGRAQARLELGKAEEAHRDAVRYVGLKGKEKDPQGHLLKGRASLACGEPELALADFEKALSLDATLADAAWGRAGALDALGRERDAEEARREFHEKWPQDPRGGAGPNPK